MHANTNICKIIDKIFFFSFVESYFEECENILKSHIQKISNQFNAMFLKSSLEFLFYTIIQHRNLYKIAFCKEQDEKVADNIQMNLETISNQLEDLANAQEIEIWEKEQKLKDHDAIFVTKEKVSYFYMFIRTN